MPAIFPMIGATNTEQVAEPIDESATPAAALAKRRCVDGPTTAGVAFAHIVTSLTATARAVIFGAVGTIGRILVAFTSL